RRDRRRAPCRARRRSARSEFAPHHKEKRRVCRSCPSSFLILGVIPAQAGIHIPEGGGYGSPLARGRRQRTVSSQTALLHAASPCARAVRACNSRNTANSCSLGAGVSVTSAA